MKQFKLLLILTFLFVSCSNEEEQLPVISAVYNNLHAPQEGGQGQPISGPFTKFSFETGETTSGNDWDVAFRGTSILVNGGSEVGIGDEPARTGEGAVSIVDGVFNSVLSADGLAFSQDSSSGTAVLPGSGNGWYVYNPQAYLITPIPGKILVFKTNNGHYAKLEILSYYKDAPSSPNAMQDPSRYYTFNYVYNPNKGNMDLQ